MGHIINFQNYLLIYKFMICWNQTKKNEKIRLNRASLFSYAWNHMNIIKVNWDRHGLVYF